VDIRRSYVLRAETNANQSRGDALQERPAVNKLEKPRRLDTRTAEHTLDHVVLNENLHALCGARGEFAPILHRGKVVVICRERLQRLSENVGGGDGILNGQIYADAANRRHRMSRIADAQEAGPPPSFKAIHDDG